MDINHIAFYTMRLNLTIYRFRYYLFLRLRPNRTEIGLGQNIRLSRRNSRWLGFVFGRNTILYLFGVLKRYSLEHQFERNPFFCGKCKAMLIEYIDCHVGLKTDGKDNPFDVIHLITHKLILDSAEILPQFLIPFGFLIFF